MSTDLLDQLCFVDIPAAAVTRKTATGRRRRWLRLPAYALVVLALIALAGGGAWWAQFRYGHIVSADASVKGRLTDIGARFDGVVAEFSVDAGDRVQAGDVLARLDDRHLQAARRKALAELERAKQRLDVERLAIEQDRRYLTTRLSQAMAASTAAAARTEAAESEADQARRELDRVQNLQKLGASAADELADAETALRTAKAKVAAARADAEASQAAHAAVEVELQGLAVREAGLALYEARVEVARADVAEAEADVEASIIRAPEGGRVVRRIVEAGGSVRVGQPIVTVWLDSEAWVEAWVRETELDQLELGAQASLSVGPFADRVLSGRVESIGMLTDREFPEQQTPRRRQTRIQDGPMVNVRIALDDPPDDLLLGLSALVSIPKSDPTLAPKTVLARWHQHERRK